MTSQHVRWHDDEARGYDAEGQSINELEHDLALEHFADNPADANNTANTAATSTWLPPGAEESSEPSGPRFFWGTQLVLAREEAAAKLLGVSIEQVWAAWQPPRSNR